jgi:hypothetical protein
MSDLLTRFTTCSLQTREEVGVQVKDGGQVEKTTLETILRSEDLAMKVLSYTGVAPFVTFWSLTSLSKVICRSMRELKPLLFNRCSTVLEKFYSERKGINVRGLVHLYDEESVRRVEVAGGSMLYILGDTEEFSMNRGASHIATDVDIFVEIDAQDTEELRSAQMESVSRHTNEVLKSKVFLCDPGSVRRDQNTSGGSYGNFYESFYKKDRFFSVANYLVPVDGIEHKIQIIYWHSDSYPWNICKRAEFLKSPGFDELSILPRFDIEVCACAYQIALPKARQSGDAESSENPSADPQENPKFLLVCLHPDKVIARECSISQYSRLILDSLGADDSTQSVVTRLCNVLTSAANTESRWLKYYRRGYCEVSESQILDRINAMERLVCELSSATTDSNLVSENDYVPLSRGVRLLKSLLENEVYRRR